MQLQLVQSVEDILWVLVLIGVMINIHEAGHFWAARFFDVKVETFSFGFGKRLFGFRRGETDFRFSLIPFGGYVKMAGEQGGEGGLPSDPRSLLAKPRWQRLIIALAGPMMNVALAVGLLTGLYMVSYPKISHADEEAVIGDVLPDSAAAKAGIEAGDRIVKLDSAVDPTWEDVKLKEATSAYRAMSVTVDRNGRRLEMDVTPTLNDRSGVGSAGWDKRGEVELFSVDLDMPAGKAGLKIGDVVLSVNGRAIDSVNKLHNVTETSGGKTLHIEYERDGRQMASDITPVYDKKDGPARWMIGVGPALKPHYINTRLSLPAALNESLDENAKGATLIGKFLEGMVQRRMSPEESDGPDRHDRTFRRRGARRPFGIPGADVDGQPEPGDFQSAAHPDSGRRVDPHADRGDGDAPRPEPERERSGVQGRICVYYAGGGVRALQRYFALPAGRLVNPVRFRKHLLI